VLALLLVVYFIYEARHSGASFRTSFPFLTLCLLSLPNANRWLT